MPNSAQKNPVTSDRSSELVTTFKDQKLHDMMYMFLQNVFRRVPEDRFHTLLKESAAKFSTDREIYEDVQAKFASLRTMTSPFTFDLPALGKQKSVLSGQTLELLKGRAINGYAEIGSTGRYISALRKKTRVEGPIYLINDKAPGFGLEDIFERGGIAKVGSFVSIGDQGPISREIPDGSLDVVTCYVGLHHVPQDRLPGFVQSIHRILRKGGVFILRDHRADTPEMVLFCSAIHTVFNLGTSVPWKTNETELRFFNSLAHWSQLLAGAGFKDSGARLYQDHDPSANALMKFEKV